MRFRLTPPGAPIFFVSLILAVAALATLYTHVPFVGHYVGLHRFWVMAAAYAVLLAGVLFEGLQDGGRRVTVLRRVFRTMQAPFDRNMARMDFQPSCSHTAAMNAILFDTLRLSRTLRGKGHFTPEQAEALAEALGEAAQGDLATKADLAAAKSELKTEIADLRTELKIEIAGSKTDLLKWIVGATGFQTVVILGAVVSLARVFAK